MNFPSIDIQGSIIAADLLSQIRAEQASFQQGKDFKAEYTHSKLKDEISFAWQEAKGQWIIYKSKLNRLKEGETGTSETRNFWMIPLLSNLGYNLSFNRQSEEINGKIYPISHADSNLDAFPVYIGGYHESLDKRPENKQLRVSPHALLQEYLNACEHLYGLVTNGKQLRLLRDASRITRLSYVEFNLEKIMEEDLYADFVILFRLLHASRMPKKQTEGAESIIEKYHQEGLAAGSTIRNKLGDAVKSVIETLANEFINHPDNFALRQVANEGNLNLDEYYRHQLRIIYRFLFLFVIEERNLVYAESKTPETKRFNQIYAQFFSLMRLRKLAKKLPPPDALRHNDLWQSLITTFSLYEKKEIGENLGIMALQGDLFSYNAITCPYYDLHESKLNNATILKIFKSLAYFENDKGIMIAVNYGGLDVEEFGSVYEGLLELKLKLQKVEGSERFLCTLDTSNERGKSGSHYTPEELVQPLIKHSLEYLIQDRIIAYQQKKATKDQTLKALLDLKICDVACGSGHILLSAARRLALEVARVQTDEEQPNPLSIRKAMKQVIRACIYGVDKNPLAIELCKIALWLESHNPGEPLNFLDHHIKCGDAIVGLAHREELQNGIADEAFKTLPGDDKNIAKTFRDKNSKERKERLVKGQQAKADFEKTTENSVQEAITEYKAFNQLPENSPEEIERKAKAYQKFMEGKGFSFLKAMADTQVAQFFIPKTSENKDSLMTDADFRLVLSGYKGWQDRKEAKAKVVSLQNRFFHWFLEFPEVFQQGGFDSILGNPPFLGGQKLSGTYGDAFLECIKYEFSPIGAVDFVTYFFRRIFTIIKEKGFQSLISTNTIAQGSAREDGLDIIIKQGGTINHAVKSMKWSGKAAVEVALVTITKQVWKGKFVLAGKEVTIITPYLDDAETLGNPFPLKQNENKSFQGSIVLGKGFVLEPHAAQALIQKNPDNKDVLFPYLNGDDLNNNPDQSASRWVINFFNFPLRRFTQAEWAEIPEKEKETINDRIFNEQTVIVAPPTYNGQVAEVAEDYPDCLEIVERLVKPERQRTNEKGEYELRKPLPQNWWIYAEKRPGLYREITPLKRVLVVAQVSKTVGVAFVQSHQVISMMCIALMFDENFNLALIHNSLHKEWVYKYASALKSDIRYTPSDVFETFPFPQNLSSHQEQQLESIGEIYHEHRKQLMLQIQLGLTKTYNLFHSHAITAQGYQEKDKQILALQKHLAKTPNTLSLEAALQGIRKLRALHIEMDNAVLAAYGWDFDSAQSPQAIDLRHDFYEVDYLPENDRIRYTIHPEARKEVLKRLLALNHQIHAAEVAAGLWEKKNTTYKKSVSVDEVQEEQTGYGGLFE